MKIGIVLTRIGVEPGYEHNVSGHVQIPLRTAELLQARGHEVHIIATQTPEQSALPACMPSGCELHLIEEGRRRNVIGERYQNGYRPLKLIQQLWQTRQLAKTLDLDVLHLFGFERMVRLAGVLKLIGVRSKVVATVLGRTPASYCSWVYRRVDEIITATESVRQAWLSTGAKVTQAPHGILRDLSEELQQSAATHIKRHRVLFWREASVLGGGDLCLAAFEKLAPRFPGIEFNFAIRKTAAEVPGIDEAAAHHDNIVVHRFPYQNGVDLAKLMTESICVVLPFKNCTIQPQLAVAESLAMNVPVVSSNIHSIPELVIDGQSGLVVPFGDVDALAHAVERLLSDEELALQLQQDAAQLFHAKWNWDNYAQSLDQAYARVTGQASCLASSV